LTQLNIGWVTACWGFE